MESAKEHISAAVRSHCKTIGLSHHQTRAAVTAALNQYGRDVSRDNGQGSEHNEPRPVLEGRAIAEGNRLADKIARGNGHG